MKSKSVFCILALALAVSAATSAEVYKWTDEQGRPQYSNRPPPGVEAQRLDIRTAPDDKARHKTGQSRGQSDQNSRSRRQAEIQRLERRVVSKQIKAHKIQARNYDPGKCAAVKRQAEWLKKQDPLAYSYNPDYQLLGQKISLYCYP